MDLTASIGLSLTGDELPTAVERLQAQLASDDRPDVRLALGLAAFLVGVVDDAEAQLRQAFLGFQRTQRVRRAALTAAHLGRVEYHAFVNPVVAAGWFARGVELLGDDDCVERGWLALGMLGCSVSSADELHRNAALALDIARRHRDIDLQCRALADYGLALVGQGDTTDGMAHIDHAMAMVHSGECTNVYVTGQVQCSFISACQRVGDLPRLEGWLSAAARAMPDVLGAAARPNLILGHCRIEYGALLCLSGRWREAEDELRAAARHAAALQKHQQILVNCALAELRISQGRLSEATELLAGLEGWDESRIPVIRLHLARGENDLAAGNCRLAFARFEGDRLRGALLYGLLVEAELARGDLDAATLAATELAALAGGTEQRPMRARAALATARVARAHGDVAAATAELERGLRLLDAAHWTLLRADLQLELASTLVADHPHAAAAHAREALAIYTPIAAPQRFAAQRILSSAGEPAPVADPLAALTPREREIIQLLAQGLSNPQIGARLVISPKTAEHHVGAILRKLNLSTRSEAAVYAATLHH